MRAKEFLREGAQTISLEQLYQGDYPDRDEEFWDHVRPSDFKTQMPIQTMQRHLVMITMLGMYQAEHIDEVVDMLEPEQLEVVQEYENDPDLSNKIVLVCDNRIIDGNHRALAAALKGVPIKYVELTEDEIDEEVNPDVRPGFNHIQQMGDFVFSAKSSERDHLTIFCYHKGDRVGEAQFVTHRSDARRNDAWLESDITWVNKEYRGQGIASMMYAYAKMLGNDIKPSGDQLPPGRDMWKSWKKSGDDKHLVAEEDIKIPGNQRAKEWINKVYELYPGTWQNNHVMTWGEGENQHFCMFELVPSFSKKDAVEVKWFQAYPLRGGVGSRGMKELQRLAKEDGISLTLFPWDKGQVSQAALTRFYKKQGYKPIAKGGRSMYWTPEIDEAELDPTGWGNTPQGTDVDYFGVKVQMRPSMFLKLAAPLTSAGENPKVVQHMEKGGKIAYPFLDIKEPAEWEAGDFTEDARVKTHEGRNRMKKWIEMKGDEPIQVNLFFRGANRSRYITKEMIARLNQGMIGETGNYVAGPLFRS